MKAIDKKREVAIANCDTRKILMNLNAIEDEMVSHFLMAMDVRRSGEGGATTYDTKFVSEEIRLKIQQSKMNITLEEKRGFLL